MTRSVEGPGQHWLRTFALVWTGQAFSLVGSSLVQFALVWWLTKTTGSAVVLTTATFVALLPNILLSPFAGALVDRWNRKWVMVIADGSIALATLSLAFLFMLGLEQVWQIYVILFLRALGSVFQWPAMQASTALMVPDEHLTRVAGANQTLQGIAGIAAPPLGALLMELIPFYGVISVDVITAIMAITPLLFVKIPQPENTTTTPLTAPKQLFHEVAEGARYLAGWRGALSVVALAVFVNFLLAPSETLLPLLVTKHFNGGAWQLGLLESTGGVGMVVGGLILSAWGGFKRRIATSLLGILGIGVGVLLTGLAPASIFLVAVAGYSVAGFMGPMANGPIFAILQAKVAPEMQGRVFTLINSSVTAMMPLSMLVAAPVAEFFGVRAWFLIGGALTILLTAAAFFVPSIMNMEDAMQEIKPTAVAKPEAEAVVE
ncbi:MAG: MFS transporter [Anaerolineaceae bacterium]|jgi:DHA3 family macrolide efflux protein-like MFS transporter